MTVLEYARPDWHRYFLGVARAVSARASCPRKRVGCVLVKDKRILSVGYNGAPAGHADCLEAGCHMDSGHCIRAEHSEMNALMFLKEESRGAIAYVTVKPCYRCARALTQAGVEHVYYNEDYGGAYPVALNLRLIHLEGV